MAAARGLLQAIALLAIATHQLAVARCGPARCTSIQLTVASCSAVHVDAKGDVKSGKAASSTPGDATVHGMLIVASRLVERTIPCHAGAPPTEQEPPWAARTANRFFVASEDIFSSIRGKTVTGKTEYPCCDWLPPPGVAMPGTCSLEMRKVVLDRENK